jgi:DNA-directed RNA polymerase II subunit RPB1
MNLTFPEIVTKNNIGFLSKLVKNGRDKYPGANFVFSASSLERGTRIFPIDLRFKRDKIELKQGDIVERHLLDDDIVLLNRQPTLHKQSMMGHRVNVIKNPAYSTFRLNVAVTTP